MADGPLNLLVVRSRAGEAPSTADSGFREARAVLGGGSVGPRPRRSPAPPAATRTSGSCRRVGPWGVGTGYVDRPRMSLSTAS